MSEIDSRAWTGPPDPVPPGYRRTRLGSVVRRYPVHGGRQPIALASDVRTLLRISICLVLLSPLVLWLAWWTMTAITGDAVIADNRAWLMLGAACSAALGVAQIAAWRNPFVAARTALTGLVLITNIVGALAYVVVGSQSHAKSARGVPQRTFELTEVRGSGRTRYTVILHQREDGTLLEGGRRKNLPYGTGCALAQRLVGPHGFAWVRVLERTPSPQRGQLLWPIRREDCFSTKPIASIRS